jgi:hypothetical protein
LAGFEHEEIPPYHSSRCEIEKVSLFIAARSDAWAQSIQEEMDSSGEILQEELHIM